MYLAILVRASITIALSASIVFPRKWISASPAAVSHSPFTPLALDGFSVAQNQYLLFRANSRN
jgi:hypothetical protein